MPFTPNIPIRVSGPVRRKRYFERGVTSKYSLSGSIQRNVAKLARDYCRLFVLALVELLRDRETRSRERETRSQIDRGND